MISIPFSLSLLAALFNGTFGVLTLHFYMRCKRFVDHHHALLLSETISALLHQLLLYCSLIAMSFNSEFGYTSTAAFFSIALATLFVHSGSYFANTSLLFLAIVRPLKYRSPLTARQSIRLLTVIWLSSSLIATCMGLSAAALFYPQSTSIKCLLDRCKWPLGFMIVCVFAIFYVVVILLYLIMIWHLNKRRHNDMQKQRLTLQLIAFTLSGAPILGVSAFTLLNLDRIKLLGLESSSPCAFFLKCDLFAQAERLVCVNVSACILPMIIVPLINCYVDGHTREVAVDICGVVFACLFSFSTKPCLGSFFEKAEKSVNSEWNFSGEMQSRMQTPDIDFIKLPNGLFDFGLVEAIGGVTLVASV
ncbi:unnamed protein product [Anisakis simplex]|uniref:G-protein coupled receptors family 1 profile domain-containing protein n=1 Tax=Anisakis simplex TaxID=6269 RepID=A0A3P6Q8F5_ANISI|nr:unnamed protein product [Anisakis simplex]